MKEPVTAFYRNTAKHDVLRFVESLDPTPQESLYLRKLLQKGSLSMRDVKLLLEYVVIRAAETPLQAHQCSALGVTLSIYLTAHNGKSCLS